MNFRIEIPQKNTCNKHLQHKNTPKLDEAGLIIETITKLELIFMYAFYWYSHFD